MANKKYGGYFVSERELQLVSEVFPDPSSSDCLLQFGCKEFKVMCVIPVPLSVHIFPLASSRNKKCPLKHFILASFWNMVQIINTKA
jgi:hypothetical protein